MPIYSKDADNQVQTLTHKIRERLEKIIAETEGSLHGLTSKLATGEIELNNHIHEDKLIQWLILLQQVHIE